MKVENHYCDACGAPIELTAGLAHGLSVCFGHSPGGWGARVDIINWSGEVCDHCYRRLGVVQAKLWGDRLAAIRTGQPAPELPMATTRASWPERLRSRLTTLWPWRR